MDSKYIINKDGTVESYDALKPKPANAPPSPTREELATQQKKLAAQKEIEDQRESEREERRRKLVEKHFPGSLVEDIIFLPPNASAELKASYKSHFLKFIAVDEDNADLA